MESLDQSVVLITGGGSGIGAATAQLFAEQGSSVFVVDIDEAAGLRIAEQVGGKFHRADVSSSADVAEAFERCEQEYGGIDVAFLNAGIAAGIDDIALVDDAIYHRITSINLDGVVFGVRAAIPALKRRGGGAIVATASMAGFTPYSPDPLFAATKLAIVGLIRSVAPSLEYHNITANTVNPSVVDTNTMTEETKYRLAQSGVEILTPAEVAETVLQIVKGNQTGECWICEGGRENRRYEFEEMASPLSRRRG